ncbi:hypothetical protein B296_00054975 [Ensete ventricosum]|uniref:K+ potassium transporter integral membrane domain-containing protein n=1 Tax=Ensete ventricosum TaxID=4639 RepID=A0A426Y1K9_ENSVE|nr:hypothetical protein B296_00054975 [Ensete ventricosum]
MKSFAGHCLQKSYRTTLLLAYQSFGVVYGDLSISPIYVYKSTFSGKLRLHEEDAEILGVLSLVFWTLTLIALCKYIIFVLVADDDGEGGTFALYSLMCRNSKMGLLSTPHAAQEHLTAYNPEAHCDETRTSLSIKRFIEKSQSSRLVLLLFVLLGTSMVIGDGVLTPTMSGKMLDQLCTMLKSETNLQFSPDMLVSRKIGYITFKPLVR